jgi:hypothetical protein
MKSQRKNNDIEWTLEELISWSEVPHTFIMMIVTNGWMNNIYMGNEQQDNRLKFVRKWWKENVNEKGIYIKREKNPKFEVKQLKLF